MRFGPAFLDMARHHPPSDFRGLSKMPSCPSLPELSCCPPRQLPNGPGTSAGRFGRSGTRGSLARGRFRLLVPGNLMALGIGPGSIASFLRRASAPPLLDAVAPTGCRGCRVGGVLPSGNCTGGLHRTPAPVSTGRRHGQLAPEASSHLPFPPTSFGFVASIPDSLPNWFYRDKRYEVNALPR